MDKQEVVRILEKILKLGKLCKGSEQEPNREQLWECIDWIKKLNNDKKG